MSEITKIEVLLHEPDLEAFLSDPDGSSQEVIDHRISAYVDTAYTKLKALYPEAKITVETGQTNGMGDEWYIESTDDADYFGGRYTGSGSSNGPLWDTYEIAQTVLDDLGNDWSWCPDE